MLGYMDYEAVFLPCCGGIRKLPRNPYSLIICIYKEQKKPY